MTFKPVREPSEDPVTMQDPPYAEPAPGPGPAGSTARAGTSRSRLVRLYGASPWHLLALLACFAVTAYTVTLLVGNPTLRNIIIWFVGSAIAWDLFGGPLLAAADFALRPLRSRRLLLPLRVPLLISALLLLVWAPVIFQRSEGVYRQRTNLNQDPYLGRWVVITVVLFAVSLAVWGVQRARSCSRRTTEQ